MAPGCVAPRGGVSLEIFCMCCVFVCVVLCNTACMHMYLSLYTYTYVHAAVDSC